MLVPLEGRALFVPSIHFPPGANHPADGLIAGMFEASSQKSSGPRTAKVLRGGVVVVSDGE